MRKAPEHIAQQPHLARVSRRFYYVHLNQASFFVQQFDQSAQHRFSQRRVDIIKGSSNRKQTGMWPKRRIGSAAGEMYAVDHLTDRAQEPERPLFKFANDGIRLILNCVLWKDIC